MTLSRLLSYVAAPVLLALFLVTSAPAQAQTFTFTGGDQTFTVPADGTYRLAARGADGGTTGVWLGNDGVGGSGAEVAATFQLQAGDELTVVVGAAGGGSAPSAGGGGGGGSAVIVERAGVRTLLIVAGGAGASGEGYSGRGGTSSDGTAGGGVDGGGGGGGGGGFNDAGDDSPFGDAGGAAGMLAGGGTGGSGYGGAGGFGFGGGGAGSGGGGGGGGGFGGGDATYPASGGSSFVETAGTNGFVGTAIARIDGTTGGGSNRNGGVSLVALVACGETLLADVVDTDANTITLTFSNPDGLTHLSFDTLTNLEVDAADGWTSSDGANWDPPGADTEVTFVLQLIDPGSETAAYAVTVSSPCANEIDGTLEATFSDTVFFPPTCVPGDYTLLSQAEVDAFAALGCTEVTGTLRIEGASDLSGLDALTSVGNDLQLVGNTVTSLDGLDALTSVGGSLLLQSNAALTDGACALAGIVSGDPPTWSGVSSGQVFVGNNGGAPFDAPANLLAAVAACFNQRPVITAVIVPADPMAVGADVAVSAPFTDPDVGDTHTCSVDYGDGTKEEGTVDGFTCTGTHAYTEAGIYTVSVTVTDEAGESDTEAATDYVVVYDPSAGFVTGGGWIDSPAGAYAADATLTGKASFGFVAKYKRGQSAPDGNTQFQFKAAGFTFESTAYDWLVVAGTRAKFKGVGTVDGAGDFGFMLTATDADPDLFRIKIWDRADGDAVVYDNQMGAADDGDAGTALGGGQVVLHDGRAARGGPASASLQAEPVAFGLEAPYPNPATGRATVAFAVEAAGPVRLAVYDALGREVAVLVDRTVEAGRHTAVLDGASLPTGTYLVRLTAGAQTATERLTRLR